jgi:hypothetical protein
MTAYSSKCEVCQQHCDWIPSPVGGWWMHRIARDETLKPLAIQPGDDHDPRIDWQPLEYLNEHNEWVTA